MIGPVFSIEMLRSARRKRLYSLRAVYGLILLGTLFVCYSGTVGPSGPIPSLARIADFSRAFFEMFSLVQVLLFPVVAALMGACLITEERERRTIDYLFASDLSNFEIVLSKFLGKIVQIIGYVSLALPILMLSLWFGGVSVDEVLKSSVVMMCSVVLFGSIGVLISATCARSQSAVLRTLLIVGNVFYVLPFVVVYFLAVRRMQQTNFFLELMDHAGVLVDRFSPLSYLFGVFEFPLLGWSDWGGVQRFAHSTFWLSLAFLVTASLLVRRCHTYLTDGGYRTSHKDSQPWKPSLGRFPVLWKEIFIQKGWAHLGRRGRAVVLLLLGVFLASSASLYWRTLSRRVFPQDLCSLVATAHAMIAVSACVLIALRSGAVVVTERERQSWESLIATPVPTWEIVAAKCLGSVYAVRWIAAPILCYAGIEILVEPSSITCLTKAGLAMLLLFVCFSMLGLAFSLQGRTSFRSAGSVLVAALVLQGLYVPLIGPILGRNGPEILFELTPMGFLVGAGTPPYYTSSELPHPFAICCLLYSGVSAALFALCVRWVNRERQGVQRMVPAGL